MTKAGIVKPPRKKPRKKTNDKICFAQKYVKTLLLEKKSQQETEPLFVACPHCELYLEITELRCGTITHSTKECGGVFQVTKNDKGKITTTRLDFAMNFQK